MRSRVLFLFAATGLVAAVSCESSAPDPSGSGGGTVTVTTSASQGGGGATAHTTSTTSGTGGAGGQGGMGGGGAGGEGGMMGGGAGGIGGAGGAGGCGPLDTSLSDLTDAERAHLQCVRDVRVILNELNSRFIGVDGGGQPTGLEFPLQKIASVCARKGELDAYAPCSGTPDATVYALIEQAATDALGLPAGQSPEFVTWFAYDVAEQSVSLFENEQSLPDPSSLDPSLLLCATASYYGAKLGVKFVHAVTGENQLAAWCSDCLELPSHTHDLGCVCALVEATPGPEGTDVCDPSALDP